MNQNNDHDFRQFKGAFDDAMIPDDAFKAKMERLLQAEAPAVQSTRSTVLASPSKQSSSAPIPGRRSHPLTVAAAVLTVFAVVAASMWVLSGSVLEGEYASAPSGIPTMPADAPGTPGPDVELTAEKVPWLDSNKQLVGVYGDILITQEWMNEGDQTVINPNPGSEPVTPPASMLTAIDTTSGDQIWQIENADIGSLVYSGSTLFGYRYDWTSADRSLEPAISLVAMDSETGDELWSVVMEADLNNPFSAPFTPIVVEGSVVTVFENGVVSARNAQTGESVWETTIDPGEGWLVNVGTGDGETKEVTQYAVNAVVWEDQVIIVNGDGLVHMLEPTTGEINHTLKLELDLSSMDRWIGLQLAATPSGVLMVTDTFGPDGSRYGMLTFNPETGEILWQREFNGHMEVDVSEQGNIAANEHIWKDYPVYLRPFGLAGYSTFQFYWIDGETGEDILVTERGKLETSQITLTDGEYACTRTAQTEIICFDQDGTRHILSVEIRGYPILADGAMYVDTPDGMYRVVLP